MRDDEDQPQSIRPLKDIGEEMSEEQRARKASSPAEGYPAGTTDPQGGLTGKEGRVNADAAPEIVDDAAHGQTQVPASPDDTGEGTA
jgi:hypothetical protein